MTDHGCLPTITALAGVIYQWDFGGLPWWLLQERDGPPMKLRTYDERFIHYVDLYFAKLLPLIQPLLYENGGPVIMIQVSIGGHKQGKKRRSA